MNILGFICSLLLILSLSFFSCFEKRIGSRRLASTYLGHTQANRKILRSYENELYDSFPHKPKEKKAKQDKKNKKRTPSLLTTNGQCARLNLSAFLNREIEENRFLYDLTQKLLHEFYGESLFKNETKLEKQFLDTFLQIAKAHPKLPLEKFNFENRTLQEIYYQMLKGTKKNYPSLLDYLQINPEEEVKICLFHTHPKLLSVLFSPKVAENLYTELHKEELPLITKEMIERICQNAHFLIIQPELFELIKMGRPTHPKGGKRTLIETDSETAITLRKDFNLKIN